jgi:HEAT repeats
MPQPDEFTRQFARLVWLAVHHPATLDAQKAALRSAIAETRSGRRAIEFTDLNHAVAEGVRLVPPPMELPWLTELALRMGAHSVGGVDVAASAKAADLLGLTRVLASAAVQGDDGANFDARIVTLAPTTVAVRLGREGFVRGSLPLVTTGVDSVLSRNTPTFTRSILEPVSGQRLGIQSSTPSPQPALGQNSPRTTSGTGDDTGRMIEAAFATSGSPANLRALLAQLQKEPSLEVLSPVLDELVHQAEDYARGGLWSGVADVVGGMLARDTTTGDPNLKRILGIHLRRLTKPGVIRGLSQHVVRHREAGEVVHEFLARAGVDGAEVLVDLLVTADQPAERRAYREAILHCPAAGPTLVHLLEDPRWYVVRNVVELIAELSVPDAELRVAHALRHADARVRRSAAAALGKLASPRALHALQRALGDDTPAVRLQAVLGLSLARNPRSVPSLVQALDREEDPDVQNALLAALGNHATEEAVDRLLVAVQPGSLLNRKPGPLRLAAASALAAAGTPDALAAVRGLLKDRDRDVKAAAERLLATRTEPVGS